MKLGKVVPAPAVLLHGHHSEKQGLGFSIGFYLFYFMRNGYIDKEASYWNHPVFAHCIWANGNAKDEVLKNSC